MRTRFAKSKVISILELARVLAPLTYLGVVFSAPAFAQSLAAQGTVRKIMLTGEYAPGMTLSVVDGLSEAVINDTGAVAFSGSACNEFSVPLCSYENAAWSTTGGTLNILARSHQMAPGTDDPFRSVYVAHLGAQGQALIGGQTADTFFLPRHDGFWSHTEPHSLEPIAVEGRHAPGLPPTVVFADGASGLRAFQHFVRKDDYVAFLAHASGPEITEDTCLELWTGGCLGIWAGSAQQEPNLIAHTGADATGTEAGTYFTDFRNSPGIARNGNFVFSGSVSGTQTGRGIWIGSQAGDVSLVAIEGQQLSASAEYSLIYRGAAISSAGVAFVAQLNIADLVYPESIRSVLTASGASRTIARTEMAAPGTSSAFRFFDVGDPIINDAANVAFAATLYSGEKGIWSEGSSGALRLVALEGQQAPGLPFGTLFGSGFSRLVLNSAGQLAFTGNWSGQNASGTGLWVERARGDLVLAVRQGDIIEARPGVFRAVSSIGFIGNSGNDDGRPSGFSDNGDLVVHLSFSDDSQGIFVIPTLEGTLMGDFNGDGRVDAGDYVRWRNNLGDPTEEDINSAGDGFNGVDLADYAWWRQRYGNTHDDPGSGGLDRPGAVPEPAGVVLYCSWLAALPMLISRRRERKPSPKIRIPSGTA